MNEPYLLLPLGILMLLLYCLSSLMVKTAVISKVSHRKLWNTLLLLTFLSTAALGFLLAIQVNYKLEWPIVKPLLKWHVNLGIAMSMVGVFHLLWNVRYYISLFRPATQHARSEHMPVLRAVESISRLKLAVMLLGFISTIIQVLLIREITTVFQGNELMMAWTLGAWMLLTGAGTLVGRFTHKGQLASFNPLNIIILLAILALILVVLLEVFKPILFLPGVMVSPQGFLVVLFLVLAPVCLLSGFLFSFFVRIAYRLKTNFTVVYAVEAIGSMIGGGIVSFVLIQWISVAGSLLVLLLLIGLILSVLTKRTGFYILSAVVFLGLLSVLIFRFDIRLKSFLFINQNIITSCETRHGNITVTESAGQYSVFQNGTLLFTSDNLILNEEHTHFALLQRSYPKDVLIVSGGISGMINEVLKYETVKNLDYVEINPDLIQLAAKIRPLPSDKRLHIFVADGRRFIRHSVKKYDVVIFAIPEPSSLQINRFYTCEFVRSLKSKLKPGAVILYSLSSSGNYLSNEKMKIENTVYATLKTGFQHVSVIPGERDYFLASDSAIRTDIATLSAMHPVDNKFVNPYYIDDASVQHRADLIKAKLGKGNELNLDARPLPVFYHTLQFISEFSSQMWVYFLLPVVFLLLPLFFMRSVAAGMYIAGFTASSFEILLIFSFQIFYGFVYSAIGIIISVFMGGLALGSFIAAKVKTSVRHFVAVQSILVVYALLFPFFWHIQDEGMSSWAGLLLFSLVTLIISAIVGFQYVVGAKSFSRSAIRSSLVLYATDLIGAALGVILITIILLPLAGVTQSCFILAGINFLGVLISILSLYKNKDYIKFN